MYTMIFYNMVNGKRRNIREHLTMDEVKELYKPYLTWSTWAGRPTVWDETTGERVEGF